LRVRIHRGFWSSRPGLSLLVSTVLAFLTGAGIFTSYYVRYARMIQERLSGPVFASTSSIYTAPRLLVVGQPMTVSELLSYLQRAGYAEGQIPGALGRYAVRGSAVEIWPAAHSYFGGKNALRVEFSGSRVAKIHSLDRAGELSSAELEPELLTLLFDSTRAKRRPVRFTDLPKHVVNAVLAAEDRRFFEHPGFDPIRVIGAAWVDVRRGEKAQGASTITMQVSRSFFFSTERTWRRKLAETLVALQLEQRFSKEQIFELYANQIYLGNRGSFAIHGFGEAARAYFGKDVRELNLGEAAFLAGIIRAPNRYSSADRKGERAAEARDRVLAAMVENRMVSPESAAAAKEAPLRMVSYTLEASSAPHFTDMIRDHLLDDFSETDLLTRSLRIYTTLDAGLQRAAAEAVEMGLQHVDQQLARRYERWRRSGEPAPRAQVALVALDPRTGEIKALVGGRNYGQSQFNRVLSRRQPGSVFKPFVYAAAFANAVDGYDPVLTPVTTVVDEPTTFYFDDQEYTPNNYGQDYYGTVTLREALTRSLNVATVKVAELVGYGRVVEVARQMGLDPRIQPTPAVALGAYEMTPLEVAAGYTAFATGGTRAAPYFVRSVVANDGKVLERGAPRRQAALDPRVAYLVTHILSDVINRGTGAGVRARGFTAPAAGKTGTSHDGWFAGFTSHLLCVVWVGFDDNRELGLSGANSAAPVWAEFMKRAIELPGYQNPEPFAPPEGVTVVWVDPLTLRQTAVGAPGAREEVFIAGSEPTELFAGLEDAGLGSVSWLSRLFSGKKAVPPAANAEAEGEDARGTQLPVSRPPKSPAKARAAQPARPETQPTAQEKKRGFWERVFGIFGGGKKDKQQERPAPREGQSP